MNLKREGNIYLSTYICVLSKEALISVHTEGFTIHHFATLWNGPDDKPDEFHALFLHWACAEGMLAHMD